ncbi:dehydrogenase [Planococcus glaciei]|uniref:zinc-dependent alcohol dehydrogenase n=1 Tax=Planococcus glaciei TaxID=459472 RepID=UPI00069CE7AA|nr:alcohol dehydrogenase catalytic domain-containing protein [Planococcus glaciei]KOF10281.1 dehydrogenase [Planococcus glaciei]
MKTIVYESPQTVSYREKEMPEISEGWALIKSSHAGICGSDLNIYAGAHPRATAPLILGHEFSGTMVKGHPAIKPGTPVTVNPLLSCGNCSSCMSGNGHVCENLQLIGIDCDGGMADFVKVPVENVVELPEGLSLALGALVEPVAVAIHAVRQGKYIPGDSAVIFGAGTIGFCVGLVLKSYGASNITIVETNELRIEKARELGFSTINPLTDNVKSEILKSTKNAGADFVFDCAGHPSVLPHVTDVVKVRGTIVMVAAYKKPAEVNLLQGMFKELSMNFIRVYTQKDFSLAAELLNQNSEFEKLITHILPAAEAKQGFDLLTQQSNAVKVMYEFNMPESGHSHE